MNPEVKVREVDKALNKIKNVFVENNDKVIVKGPEIEEILNKLFEVGYCAGWNDGSGNI